jgi:hypothetical protein
MMMAISAFDDKANPPGARALLNALGRTGGLWTRLRDDLEAEYGPLIEEWNYWGKSHGWSMRLKRKKRAIVYMTPCRSHFVASLALGEKACAAARDEGAAGAVLKLIDAAPKYPEGRGIRVPVRSTRDVVIVEALAALKVAH